MKGIWWLVGALFGGMFLYWAFADKSIVDLDCGDFNSWYEAQEFYDAHNPKVDPHNLDPDRDGIACEKLAQ